MFEEFVQRKYLGAKSFSLETFEIVSYGVSGAYRFTDSFSLGVGVAYHDGSLSGSHDEVDVKTAYLPGFASFAIKVSTGFYGNAELGLSSLNGLMTLFSTRTGLVEALLLDNGYLTDIRTAAAGAVAARHLAPAQVEVK